MLYLLEFLDMIPPRIVGGDKYSWLCYGNNARYLDMEHNIDIIFDEKTQEIYINKTKDIVEQFRTTKKDTQLIFNKIVDNPIFKIDYHDNKLFAMTTKGISVYSLESNFIIEEKQDDFLGLDISEVTLENWIYDYKKKIANTDIISRAPQALEKAEKDPQIQVSVF